MPFRSALAALLVLASLTPAASTFAQTPPVYRVNEAMAINNADQIVALYQTATGTGTVLLTPFIDSSRPVITQASASPNVLWPPNGSMRDVTLDVRASDDIDPAPVCAITRVTNTQWRGWGDDPSVQITGNLTLSLRASRQGQGNERTYIITVRCADYAGNGTNTRLFVRVPHNHH